MIDDSCVNVPSCFVVAALRVAPPFVVVEELCVTPLPCFMVEALRDPPFDVVTEVLIPPADFCFATDTCPPVADWLLFAWVCGAG